MAEEKKTNMDIKIEKGIPLPSRPKVKRCGNRSAAFHWIIIKTMDVGDSFFTDRFDNANNLTAALRPLRMSLGFKFSVRAVEGGFRVWRVE